MLSLKFFFPYSANLRIRQEHVQELVVTLSNRIIQERRRHTMLFSSTILSSELLLMAIRRCATFPLSGAGLGSLHRGSHSACSHTFPAHVVQDSAWPWQVVMVNDAAYLCSSLLCVSAVLSLFEYMSVFLPVYREQGSEWKLMAVLNICSC